MKGAQAVSETPIVGGGWDGETQIDHPAFGLVTVSRWTSGSEGVRLFGSDLRHRAGLRIAVSKASQVRGLSRDWHQEEGELVEFLVSEANWARIVSSAGMGGGVPVTLSRYKSEGMVDAPEIAAPAETKKERHSEELRKTMQEAISRIDQGLDRLAAMAETGKVGKTELRSIVHDMKVVVSNLPKDAAYAMSTFQEGAEEAAQDAKCEIDAHVAALATRLGMKQLQAGMPSLEEPAATVGERTPYGSK